MNNAEEAVSIARSFLGVKWIHQGRNPNVGIDCAGLAVLAYNAPNDTTEYSRHPHNGLLEKTIASNMGEALDLELPIKPIDLKAGDVVAMSFNEKGVIRHVGIIAYYQEGGFSLIHTDSDIGKVVEHELTEYWLERIKKVYRV